MDLSEHFGADVQSDTDRRAGADEIGAAASGPGTIHSAAAGVAARQVHRLRAAGAAGRTRPTSCMALLDTLETVNQIRTLTEATIPTHGAGGRLTQRGASGQRRGQ